MNPDELLARRRFAILSLVRLGGAVLLTAGLIALGGKLPLPPVLAAVLVGLGIGGFIVLPRQLSRRWKSPR